ncbi:MAG: hypothetical protein J6Y89_05985 [Lachnospiraceae bacterium]|nr:hypothetical protein [Lachnospiraceae bacterium]
MEIWDLYDRNGKRTGKTWERSFGGHKHNDRYKDLIDRIRAKLNNSFSNALLSEKTDKIPDEYDWFAGLIGDWDCDYYDEPEPGMKRHVKGEWIFRRILEGAGIQDIFIFPSRATKEKEPQPDAEYGTSLRMFNKAQSCYDVVYTCDHVMKRLICSLIVLDG